MPNISYGRKSDINLESYTNFKTRLAVMKTILTKHIGFYTINLSGLILQSVRNYIFLVTLNSGKEMIPQYTQ